jgi:protease I
MTNSTQTLQGRKVAFLVAPEGFEQVELTEPWKAVAEAGGTPELVSTASGEAQGFNHLDKADTFTVDQVVSDVSGADYDALVRGRRITSWPSLATDLRNAGADWVDEQVVTDQGLVSSRNPDDLPAFCAALVEEFAANGPSRG